ncbi:MAG TPA: gfo/Idh/MocA family oxidoreductase, partial [Isosphaeraceae bacterium]|nr:gfo/Idh/MocA family oxidoreductase [Isosphaeraceae bacterium]
FEIYLEQATISLGIADVAGQGPVNPLVVILPDGSVQRPEIGAGDPIDAFSLEIAEAVQAVASGVESQSLSGLRARQALATCWAEVTSVKERRSVPIPA